MTKANIDLNGAPFCVEPAGDDVSFIQKLCEERLQNMKEILADGSSDATLTKVLRMSLRDQDEFSPIEPGSFRNSDFNCIATIKDGKVIVEEKKGELSE